MGCEFSTLLSGFHLVSLFYYCITTPLLSRIFYVFGKYIYIFFFFIFSHFLYFFIYFHSYSLLLIHPRFLVIYIIVLRIYTKPQHTIYMYNHFISITTDQVEIKKISTPSEIYVLKIK